MLLDTSGLLCLLVADDRHHEAAKACFERTPAKLLPSAVLIEFIALANARRVPRQAALQLIEDLFARPDVEVLWADEVLHREALELLRQRLDKQYSLCDAMSFVVMRRRGRLEALTTDIHFEQEGFVRLLA